MRPTETSSSKLTRGGDVCRLSSNYERATKNAIAGKIFTLVRNYQISNTMRGSVRDGNAAHGLMSAIGIAVIFELGFHSDCG
jgi:hypothetical protein